MNQCLQIARAELPGTVESRSMAGAPPGKQSTVLRPGLYGKQTYRDGWVDPLILFAYRLLWEGFSIV